MMDNSSLQKEQKENTAVVWLTIDELCRWLGLKKSRIYNWTSTGQIPHFKLGGTLYFKRIEIEEWMESKRVCVK